jgi:hypothetical protein
VKEEPKEARAWRWRGDLLSSSLLLEYRVARLLVGRKFGVFPDASFTRLIDGKSIEFSVDLEAHTLVRCEPPVSAAIRLLVECKYRRPGKAWFFVPDPDPITISDWDPAQIFRYCDYFTGNSFSDESFEQFGAIIRSCYKGVEIDLDSGSGNRVDSEELKHGLEQLQFGLAMLLRKSIRSALFSTFHTLQPKPFLFAPILVTTAPLYIARADVEDSDISSAECIDAFSENVGWLALKTNVGRDLEEHVLRTFRMPGMGSSFEEALAKIDVVRHGRGYSSSDVWKALTEAEEWLLERWFSQVIVCNDQHLDKLIQHIESTSQAAVAGIEHLGDIK